MLVYCLVYVRKGKVPFTFAFDVFNETEIPSEATSPGKMLTWRYFDFTEFYTVILLNYFLKKVLNEDEFCSPIKLSYIKMPWK